MTGRSTPRRPPVVVVGWAAVLAVTVGLAIVGRAGETVVVPPVATPAEPRPDPSWAVSAVPGRRPAPPMATRPPIGEDGVMGGLVFGTAWSWLEPRPER